MTLLVNSVNTRCLPSEPLTPVRHPPTHNRDGNRGGERPPERQDEIGNQAEQGEHNPENLALHQLILSARTSSTRSRRNSKGLTAREGHDPSTALRTRFHSCRFSSSQSATLVAEVGSRPQRLEPGSQNVPRSARVKLVPFRLWINVVWRPTTHAGQRQSRRSCVPPIHSKRLLRPRSRRRARGGSAASICEAQPKSFKANLSLRRTRLAPVPVRRTAELVLRSVPNPCR